MATAVGARRRKAEERAGLRTATVRTFIDGRASGGVATSGSRNGMALVAGSVMVVSGLCQDVCKKKKKKYLNPVTWRCMVIIMAAHGVARTADGMRPKKSNRDDNVSVC